MEQFSHCTRRTAPRGTRFNRRTKDETFQQYDEPGFHYDKSEQFNCALISLPTMRKKLCTKTSSSSPIVSV
uniref:Uncharacterized protein n=1 Tax=Heterorhabditis bacteriophora TaxID=37862 RepID=A0A1I7XBL0_HETBA